MANVAMNSHVCVVYLLPIIRVYFALAPKVPTTFMPTLLFAPNKLSLAFGMPYTRLAIICKTIAISNRTSLRENISSFKPILAASICYRPRPAKSNFQSTLLASTLHRFLALIRRKGYVMVTNKNFTTEAWYRSMVATYTTCELSWSRYLLKVLHVPHPELARLFCDNQLHIAANPV
jgi:hypothetical protein